MKEGTKELIEKYFSEHKGQEYLKGGFYAALAALLETYGRGGKILVCGNGGSAADSEHFSGELLKGFEKRRPLKKELSEKFSAMFGKEGEFIAGGLQRGIKCIPLVSFTAASTAFINDCDGRLMFSQLVNALGDQGDVLVAFSTGGNSENVVYAAMTAKALGLKVIAFTGETGGRLKEIADITFNVPETRTFKVQEMHLPLYHLLCLALENELFDE